MNQYTDLYSKDTSQFHKYVYILTFITYGTNVEQIDPDAFTTRKAAEREKSILRSCGHKKIKIIKIDLHQ